MKDEKLSLHIGLDAKRAINNTTGLGNYSRYALRALTWLAAGHRYSLYAPKIVSHHARIDDIVAMPGVDLCEPRSAVAKAFPALWRTAGLTARLNKDGIDVYHGLSNEIPLGLHTSSVAGVVTVHDLIWRRFPSDYSWADRKLYDFKYGTSIRQADRIIAISECTARDIMADYDIPRERIAVVYQGIDPIFKRVDAETRTSVAAKHGLHNPYIIAVGTVQGRKNQLLAAQALRDLPSDVHLAIVGRRTKYAGKIDDFVRQHRLGDRVHWLENVPLDDLPALYSEAVAAAYPSRYEGFGLPIVEALACGTPVIAATGSCLEEAGGPGAVYVSPDSIDEFADAARRMVDDRFFRDKLVSNGQRYIRRFNMKDFARQTVAAYQMAIIFKYMDK